jgi:catechol 2,3-dioxygenase-like lactoylglutathione lyase family enzyme
VSTGVLINIDVPDLEKAQRFYCDALALRVGRRFKGFTELLGPTAPVYLLEVPGRDYARHWTPVHLDFVVADLPAAIRRARAAGAILETGIRSEAWGSIATLADPFGNGFCLLQFTGRGYDEIEQC